MEATIIIKIWNLLPLLAKPHDNIPSNDTTLQYVKLKELYMVQKLTSFVLSFVSRKHGFTRDPSKKNLDLYLPDPMADIHFLKVKPCLMGLFREILQTKIHLETALKLPNLAG